MLTLRPSNQRGHFDHGWLNTYHTFSFGHYRDPQWMGFRSLRVINEDFIAPGMGFGEHPHDNMEIISYIAGGQMAHRDTLGNTRTISPGEVQRMSAGTGLEHSEFNPSSTQPTHLIQIWLKPSTRGTVPGYDQRKFPISEQRNIMHLLISPDGADGSLTIGQDARLYAAKVDKGFAYTLPLNPGRHAWVQVVKGSLTINGQPLGAGDGAGVSDERNITIDAQDESEFLVFDLA
jgi:redox-sensitive bicupin YhaK (pirin superfamily)